MPYRPRWAALLLLAVAALALPAWVWAGNATARLLAERTAVAPGGEARLLLVLDIRPGWHTYWQNPGDSGEPPRIDWTLPAGVTAAPLGFTVPERIPVGPLANYGYSGRALHPVSLRLPSDWPAGRPLPVRAHAHWLVCEEHCIPEEAVLDLTLATAAEPGPIDPGAAGLFAEARAGLPHGTVLGTAGGASLTEAATGAGARLALSRASLAGMPPDLARLEFFPFAWGLIEPAADQPWRADRERVTLDLVPGAAFASTDPAGLLVATGRSGERVSYRVEPVRGAPAADGLAGPAAVASGTTAVTGLPAALGLAFLGGLILNLMPCVFPVLAIKALGLAQQGALSGGERAAHGLAYTAGVLVFFALLAALLLGLRAGGAAVGWGFQLQYPPFVAAMAYLFLVVGLALGGALTLGRGLMGLAGGVALPAGPAAGAAGPRPGGDPRGLRAHPGPALAGAFGTGALAALVAAPCTAPFMGAALGYAVTLPWAPALAILLMLGLGLAAPFLLLSLWPGLARRLPRPGPWMETLKQALAFPMLAAAAWLLWVLTVQTGAQGLALVLAGMLVLIFGLWVRERTALAAPAWARGGAAAALAGVAAALWLALLTGGSAAAVAGPERPPRLAAAGPPSEPYGAERLARVRAEGRTVFVNMTAAWCITCLVNERVALATDAAARAFAEGQVLYLKGDWTNRDPAITDYLAGFGRTGVPIYVVYPQGGEPRVLPQILTAALVRGAVAGPASSASKPGQLSATERK